jgi:hypothetical protein
MTCRIKHQNFFSSQRGGTLVEELTTVAIIALGFVILVAMIYTGVLGVRVVDDEVVAETLARSQIELIKDSVYLPDPGTTPYPTVTPQPNYVVGIGVEYWNAGTSSFTSTQRNDGLQRITVTVTSGGNTITQTSLYKVDR